MQKTALLIVDFQNDYFSSFEGSKFPLVGAEEASKRALEILEFFRKKDMEVIHVRHESDEKEGVFFNKGSKGANIHKNLEPLKNEVVITKNFPNSFKETKLKEVLDDLGIKSLVIVGAMSHMCIDAGVRAANDFGYNCTVISDACATRDLEFKGEIIPARYVHSAFMSALEFGYAKVVNTKNILEDLSK